jgi:hypothetical protein
MILKPYHQLDCADDLQKIISEKTIDFLKSKTDIFLKLDKLSLWNKLNTVEVIKHVPELVDYFKTLDLKLKELSVTVCNNNKNIGLHIDELPVVAKINFPILNTKSSRNLWYSVPPNLMTEIEPIVNLFGSKFYDLSTIDLSKCKKLADVEVVKPVVFNSQIPHMINMSECKEFPRLVLTCMFFNEPVDFLKE